MAHLIKLVPIFLYGELDIVIQVRHYFTVQLHLFLSIVEPRRRRGRGGRDREEGEGRERKGKGEGEKGEEERGGEMGREGGWRRDRSIVTVSRKACMLAYLFT